MFSTGIFSNGLVILTSFIDFSSGSFLMCSKCWVFMSVCFYTEVLNTSYRISFPEHKVEYSWICQIFAII